MKAYPECSLSFSSIRRRLVEAGLNGQVARKKPLVSLKNRRARAEFAREHLIWSAVDWTKAVFSDESKFNRFGSDGNKYVRRRPGDEFMPKCAILSIKHGRGSVRVWAPFNRNGPGPLHIIESITDSIYYGRNRISQQDNDPKHSSNATKCWLHQKKITKMEWSSNSPDLNPIEHLWNDVEKEVERQKLSNIRELEITYQMKIFTTALLMYFVLNKRLSSKQWLALGVLVIGVVDVQLVYSPPINKNNIDQKPFLGLASVLIMCITSAFAGVVSSIYSTTGNFMYFIDLSTFIIYYCLGVYLEKVLKESKVSIWMQNIRLALVGLPLSIFSMGFYEWETISRG
uniref:HTH_Tnp_Tc3_2 domain-containing protein n=1 Tax=Heterorhabditis bacteriophora TaxID=37862 RepID=A0A1I7X548_HETBA